MQLCGSQASFELEVIHLIARRFPLDEWWFHDEEVSPRSCRKATKANNRIDIRIQSFWNINMIYGSSVVAYIPNDASNTFKQRVNCKNTSNIRSSFSFGPIPIQSLFVFCTSCVHSEFRSQKIYKHSYFTYVRLTCHTSASQSKSITRICFSGTIRTNCPTS